MTSPDGKEFIVLCTHEIVGSMLWKSDFAGNISFGQAGAGFGAISPDWKRLVIGRNGHAEILDAVSGNTISILAHSDDQESSLARSGVAFSCDGRRLVTGAVNGTVCLWDSETGRAPISLIGRTEYGRLPPIAALAWSPDDSQIATGNAVSSHWIWNGRSDVLHNRSSREAMQWTRYLIRDATSEAELRARVAEDPTVSERAPACAAQLAGPLWRAEVQHRVAAALETAEAHEQNQQWHEAVEAYGQAIRLDPEYVEAYSGRGVIRCRRGDYAEAIADYSEVIRLDPKNVSAFVNRGIARHYKGEFDAALVDYEQAIRLDPMNLSALICHGDAWWGKREFDKAIADYDEALRRDPKNALAFTDRGNAWYAKGDLDKAVSDYDEAIRLDPTNASAYFSRGDIWRAKGEFAKATPDYVEAARLQPDASRLNAASWGIVVGRDAGKEAYGYAIRWAEIASKIEPGNGNHLNTVGVGQYRAE
jgi:tetratricopeptide (TPR) repeat protein